MAGAGGTVFRLDVDGADETAFAVSRFSDSIQDYRPAWEEVGDHLKTVVERRFDSQGPGWAPLSPTYASWKAARYPGAPILVRTGALRGSMGSVNRAGPMSLEWGTAVRYAVFHQRGTRKMPQRKVIHLEPDDARYIHRIMSRYINRKAREAGLFTSQGGPGA